MSNEKTEPIIIKTQKVKTSIELDNKLHDITITFTNFGEKENRLNIANRDIFFDKDGNFSGDGICLQNQDVPHET